MISLTNINSNILLAPYTTYKIGGPADYFVEVESVEELIQAIKEARIAQMPYFLLGSGANILVTDRGVRGLVIRNMSDMFEFEANNRVRADSGAIVADLIEACRDKELSGLEHFVGIPSTVGGAMWQNLHFLNPERTDTLYVANSVVNASILNQDNQIEMVDRDFFRFGYDDSILHHKDVIVLDVTFQLTPQPRAIIQHQMDENMAWRIAKQPQLWDYPSCGSVFKKIEGVGAGRLIDQVGLKGKQIGQAQVSTKHANYIVNLGGAKANDVLNLIELVQSEVKQKTGYDLEPEIRVVGER